MITANKVHELRHKPKRNQKVLSEEQKTRLAELEERISTATAHWFDRAVALYQIGNEGLYVPHNSLTAYAAFTFDMSPTSVSQHLDAAELLEILGDWKVKPANEAQCRALSPLLKNWDKGVGNRNRIRDKIKLAARNRMIRDLWNVIVQGCGAERITAAVIREAVAEEFSQTRKEPNTKKKPPAKKSRIQSEAKYAKPIPSVAVITFDDPEAAERFRKDVSVAKVEKKGDEQILTVHTDYAEAIVNRLLVIFLETEADIYLHLQTEASAIMDSNKKARTSKPSNN